MFLCDSDSCDKRYCKNCYLDNFFYFWVFPPNYTKGSFMFLMQQSHVHCRVFWNLLYNANDLALPEKNLEGKDFASPSQIFKLLVWAPKIVKSYIMVAQWVIASLQSDSKQPTLKYYTYTFQIFSDNQWQKLWEKTLIRQFRVFTPFSIWTMLINNEKNLRQAMLWVRNIV